MKSFKMICAIAAVLLALGLSIHPLPAQTIPGQRMTALGNCQLSASQLGSSVGLASCVRASFTGSGSGTSLTVSSVTGVLLAGDTVTGTGAPAGTTIVAQISGTTGGAGVYRTSVATTSSAASLTSGGIPAGATMAFLQAETANVRYRDDGGAPTTAIGNLVVSGAGGQILYGGPLANIRFIGASGSPLLNIGFYR